ncbi:MAG TPA: ABC transporter ATP-binding protein, partial [Candidatus Merdenecus merdavium]|nr:ABC transporter ATP-binding protein [Candidatus Merdenecus merdavium]
ELDRFGTNSLITRINNDVNQIQIAVAMLIRLVVRAPFLIIGAAIMAMMLDFKLSLIFLVVAPLVALVLYVVMNSSIPFYRIRQSKIDKVSLLTRESLEGARVVRAFSKEEKEESRFEDANQDVTDVAIRVGKISAVLNPATFAILNLAIVAIIWFGGKRVDLGILTQGQIIAFTNYMTQISLALVVVANLVVIFTKASASAARINEVLDTEPSIVGGTLTTGGVEEDKDELPFISFKDVALSYGQDDKYSLEGVTIDIYKGETIGIIGGTGAGKSTFVNLIPRFYDVSKGSITIEGKEVKDYQLSSLRSLFGIVPQKAVLFYGSILENMRWAKEDASIEEIEKAIETAQAKEFVEKLPKKYDSMIMQGGKNLSGGQKQRLTIARALVGNPPILILDDSSSALDYATDANLRNAIKSMREDLTVFIVSQRANSIKHADRILVLDEGQVVGIGSHSELFETCQVYQEICLSQLDAKEVSL